jgi:hypothetical protein
VLVELIGLALVGVLAACLLVEMSLGRWSPGDPSAGGASDTECREPGEVDRRGEEPKVGVDARGAAHAGAAPAVRAAHQVPDLAFDLGSGGQDS